MPSLDGTTVFFSIEGTFLDKPKLLMNGQEVPYKDLSIAYLPEETIGGESFPEMIRLAFSLTGQIGQLQANVMYQVKANKDGKLVLAETEEMRPVNTQKKCSECGKSMDKCVCEEEEEETEGKKKCGVIKAQTAYISSIQPDPGTRWYKRNIREHIIEGLLEDEK
jgi:hypothetical protein